MKINNLTYEELLNQAPEHLMQEIGPHIICVKDASLQAKGKSKLADPTPLYGLVMAKHGVYMLCSNAGITLYERGIYQEIFTIDLPAEGQGKTAVFAKAVEALVPLP